MSHTEQDELTEIEAKLYSDSARSIKEALDYYSSHSGHASSHLSRIKALKTYADNHSGMGAAQIEVAAIILYNQITFQKTG